MARSGPFRPDERPHRFLFNLQPVDDYHKETKKYLAQCRVLHDVQRGSNTKFYHSFSHFISFYFSSSRNLIVYRRRCDPILRRRPRNPSNSSQASCESSNLLSNYLLSNNRESQGEQKARSLSISFDRFEPTKVSRCLLVPRFCSDTFGTWLIHWKWAQRWYGSVTIDTVSATLHRCRLWSKDRGVSR